MDRKLRLRPDHWSAGVARVAVQQGLQARSFDQAAAAYGAAVDGGISGDSIRTLTEGYGAACAEWREQEAERVSAPAQRGEAPGTERIAKLDPLCGAANLSSDGAMVLVRGEGWKEVKIAAVSAVSVQPARERPGQKPASRRAGDPLVRLGRHSYVAGLWEVDTFRRQQYAEGVRRGLERCTPLSSVNDAAEWIQRTTQENFPQAVQIIDWSHVVERLGQLASAVFGEGTRAAQHWLEPRLDRLWAGKPQVVVRALQQLEQKAPRALKAAVREQVGYFQNHQGRMHYDVYRAQGLPIGSGTVESAANTVVHNRLKRPGRGWSRPNARAMLAGLTELHSARFDRAWHQCAA